MGWDIQINPTAESLQISHGLAELLDSYLEDFNIRYAFVEPNPTLISALKSVTPRNYDEAKAIVTLVDELESGRTVEFFLAH